MSQPSELPESVRDPLAALLAGFKKEAKPYVWSYGVGGHSKEVLWYVLPASGYAPYVAPGNPPSSTPNSPYSSPATSNFPGDNPPGNVGTFPFHPNITRHWLNGKATYVVTVPNSVPPLANGTPNLTGYVQKSYLSLPATSTYTWQNWVDDVQAVMNKFVNIPTAETGLTFNGVIFEPTPYDTTLGGTIPTSVFASGTFIWSVFDSLAGPTGNGINEIILTDQTLPGLGLTSMLVDPANGQIIECDVLFDAKALIVPNPWQVGGNPVTPHNWTALPHELGHFWGLDHTNLHTGAGTSGVATVISGSAANYPAGQVTALPAMVGSITYLGPSVDVTTLPLHIDDTTGISLINPVLMPRRGSGRYPLINQTASMRGRFQDVAGNGVFGKNLWVVPALTAAAPGVYPERGVISGTARNDMDHFFMTTGVYVDNRPGFGGNYFTGASVVGLTGAGNVPGTGDFAIEGLPVGQSDFTATTGDPLEYDLVMEDSCLLGVSTTNQAEWFNEGTFYTGNLPTTTGGVPPLVMVHSSTTSTGTGAPYSINSTPSTAFTSTSVVPGSVIYVFPGETSEYGATPPNWIAPNALFSPAPPPPFYARREQVARPLVAIMPRVGRASAPNLDIRARCDLTFVDVSTAQLWINGTNQSGLLPAATSANFVSWSIPMSSITALYPNLNQPINVTFLVRAMGPAPVDPDTGAPFILGVGRNDVVL